MKFLKNLVRGFLKKFHLDLIHEFSVTENDELIKEEFGDIYKAIKPYTEASLERCYTLYKAVEYIVKYKIPGDFVECGVANGGCVMVIAMTLKKMNVTNRKIYLYDTFEGMPRPSEHDFLNGKTAEQMLNKWSHTTDENGEKNWMRYSLETVKKNVSLTGYPAEQFVYVKGMVEDTIPGIVPERICLLRLDTDFYESTKHELEHLYPKIVSGGVILFDDYGTWMGEKKAADEYFADKPILLNRVDRDGRVAIKV